MLCKTDLHFLNTRHSEEIYVCIHFLHEIPWKFTPSEFIAIFYFFFLRGNMPQAYKPPEWVKADIFIQSVLNKSAPCSAAGRGCAQMG